MSRTAIAIVLGSLVLVLAGCGGGGSDTGAVSTVTVTTTEPASTDTTSTDSLYGSADSTDTTGTTDTTASQQIDCAALEEVVTDIQLSAATDSAPEYIRDRDFLDSYAGRAPAAIADSVDQLRDFFDEFASAAQAAGLEPGATPLPDQADKIRDELQLSSDDQADNARALATIDAWTTNECS